MNPKLAFYNGKTGAFLKDFSNSIVNLWFTVGLNGVLDGTVKIEDDTTINGFMGTVEENSHFIKVGYEKVYGGVTVSSRLDDGVWTVDFTGAAGWWSKMHAVSSEYAEGGVAKRDSNAGVKVFYSDSTSGILYEVFKNQAESMDTAGWDSSVIDYSPIIDYIETNSGSSWTDKEWDRSYRLNTFETPTFDTVVNNVVEEMEYELFVVKVSSTLDTDFRFIVTLLDEGATDSHDLHEEWDDIFGVVFDFSGKENRAMGVASGTDLAGDSRIRVAHGNYDEDVAYSSVIASVASESSDAIGKIAYSELWKANSSEGNISFSMYSDDIEVLDEVWLYVDDSYWTGSIVEKDIEGTTVTYSLDVTRGYAGFLKSAPSLERRLIFNPLNEASGLSQRNARASKNSTGWRS